MKIAIKLTDTPDRASRATAIHLMKQCGLRNVTVSEGGTAATGECDNGARTVLHPLRSRGFQISWADEAKLRGSADCKIKAKYIGH